MNLWKLHKLCPSWRHHVRRTWNFQVFTPHWFCRWCPLVTFRNCGRAYRRTMGWERCR